MIEACKILFDIFQDCNLPRFKKKIRHGISHQAYRLVERAQHTRQCIEVDIKLTHQLELTASCHKQ